MFSWREGKKFFVVELDGLINLPINADVEGTALFAKALTIAIETGIITNSGTYGIEVDEDFNKWEIYQMIKE